MARASDTVMVATSAQLDTCGDGGGSFVSGKFCEGAYYIVRWILQHHYEIHYAVIRYAASLNIHVPISLMPRGDRIET